MSVESAQMDSNLLNQSTHEKGDNVSALLMIMFLSYRGVIEVDISEYHTASVLINYLDFNFILQGNIMIYHTSNYSMLSSSVL
mgnify:CR=1 FL=1